MMKKSLTIISYWMSALALVGLVACNKTPVDPSPDFDPDTNTVKTKFVLSISTSSPSTKMTAEAVQRDGNAFRGMDNVHLYSFTIDDKFKGAQGGYYMFNPDADASLKPTRDFNLATLVGAKEIDDKENNSRVVELAVPLDMNAIMLYGKAPKIGTGNDAVLGAVEMTLPAVGSSLNDVSFKLKDRLKDKDAFTAMGALLGQSMTILADASLMKETSVMKRDTRYAYWWPKDETSDKFGTKDQAGAPLFNDGDVKDENGTHYVFHLQGESEVYSWKALGAKYDNLSSLVPLEQVLSGTYYSLTNIRKGADGIEELRAGSASSVLYTLRNLAELLERSINAVPTSEQEEIARQLAQEIKNRLEFFFTGTGSSIQYKSMNDILKVAANFPNYKSEIESYVDNLKNIDNGDFFPTEDSNGIIKGGFPLNLGLPLSTALMTCTLGTDNTATFKYRNDVPAYGMGGATVPIDSYRYPAELMYWGNSSIRVSDMAKDKLELPRGVANWADDYKWSTDWERNGTVTSTTRTIAAMQQVSYGTALLRSTVQSEASVKDNRAAITGEADQVIDVQHNPSSFRVTGIFIGGIPDVVGWDFTRKKKENGLTTYNLFDKMIYDEVNPTGETKYDRYALADKDLAEANPIYTLVWDNYLPELGTTGEYIGLGTQDKQQDVYVAVEFVNNTGLDLWGELNMIPKQGTFYLVGKIDLKAAIAANEAKEEGKLQFPDRGLFHYPPFNGDGDTVEFIRVFMQDYMTKVTFKFSETSLQHAYMTVPDLRASQISLGLSVDVQWKAGLDFEVELGKLVDN